MVTEMSPGLYKGTTEISQGLKVNMQGCFKEFYIKMPRVLQKYITGKLHDVTKELNRCYRGLNMGGTVFV